MQEHYDDFFEEVFTELEDKVCSPSTTTFSFHVIGLVSWSFSRLCGVPKGLKPPKQPTYILYNYHQPYCVSVERRL